MKAVTIIAGLAGTVAAGHAHKHARHHARDTASTWSEWDPSTTAAPVATSTSSDWNEWDPTTSSEAAAAAATSWGEWDPATSSEAAAAAATSWEAWDPSTSSEAAAAAASSWGEWDPATSSEAAAASESGWSAWDPATTTVWAQATGPSACAQAVVYVTGAATWGPDAPVSYSTVTVSPTAPVPVYTQWSATGTYTISATTITVTDTITVPAPTSYPLTPGWNTFGGVTTTVTDTTTVTCPYASLKTDGTAVSTVLATTTFTCPNGGVYTIAASSASVSVSTVTVVPVAATYWPGTYTQSATTVTVTDTSTVFAWPFQKPTSAPGPAFYAAASTTAPAWTASPTPIQLRLVRRPRSSANGNTWAMTYSPYTSSGQCKDAGTVSADIAVIKGKGFTTVRVYSTDCSTLANVGTAVRANGLKLILGVFISSSGISGAQGQVSDIAAWAQWDLVELVVVGNEAVFNGYCSASALAGFISSVRGTLSAKGYTGPVSTTEPLSTWLSSGTTFCGVVDVVAANLYAFFNAQTTAANAGPFIQSEITELEGICSGKDVYVMETGWPHAGNCNGVACPSPENQVTAINSIKNVVGAKVVFFSFSDDAWKTPGQFDVEQYWGCADVFSG